MRSNIHRGKRVYDGEWVEGYHVKLRDSFNDDLIDIIVPVDAYVDCNGILSEFYVVIPETVSRLLDWACWDGDYSGQRFFQNDIIEVYYRHDDIESIKPRYLALVIDEHCITVDGRGRHFPQDTTAVRIIGNAYDNPELIEGTHNMNQFINGLREYSGSPDEYRKEHQHLMDKYDIHGAHACCYMCNFENDYICHQYNGGCSKLDICKRIREQESED